MAATENRDHQRLLTPGKAGQRQTSRGKTDEIVDRQPLTPDIRHGLVLRVAAIHQTARQCLLFP